MKKYAVIINFCVAIAVLGAMLFQSLHSYEHIFEQLSEKKCHHSNQSGAQITHDHHSFDHCFVCEFTFSNLSKADVFQFIFFNSVDSYKSTYSLFAEQITVFSGSFFSLRGPPSLF